MRGVLVVMAGSVAGLVAWLSSGCATPPLQVPDPPAAIHPADLFPAPPGFESVGAGPDAWKFIGRGSAGAAAVYYRTACVQLFEWEPVDESQDASGAWDLRYRRGDDRLHVHVGESNDRLEILVTLERGPATSGRSDTHPERKRGEATDPAGRPGGRTDR